MCLGKIRIFGLNIQSIIYLKLLMVDFCYQSDEKSHILFTSLCSIFNGTEMDRNIRIIFTSGFDFLEAVQRMHIYLLFKFKLFNWN
jgi:hypothetical protein